MQRYLRHLFQLILSPGNGWEDIARANDTPRAIASSGFYPLIAIASVSVFVQGIYHTHLPFLLLFMRMIVTFLCYFISYFFGTFILSVLLERTLTGRYDQRRADTFVLYTLGLLSLISLILNCLPVTSMMLFFLPLYVALIQWKATAYLQVSAPRTGIFMLIAILGVLLPPYFFYLLFSIIL